MQKKLKQGVVIKSTGKNYIVKSGDACFNCFLRGKMRLQNHRSTNPLAVGDFVSFSVSGKGNVIEKVFERKNHILRKATNLSKKSHVIAANIDQALLVLTLKHPKTSRLFIDRFLVSAESFGIPVILIINKTDLYSEKEFEEAKKLEFVYKDITSGIYYLSAVNTESSSVIKKLLKDKVSVISGNSGTGKSTLINCADKNLNLKTADISDFHKTGKHTTSYAEMHPLKFGGYIIDTPGIRAFGIVHIEKNELYHFFPEIFTYSHSCRFPDCRHINEPGCAVKNAVENGIITESRYQSYLNIFYDDNTKHRKADY